MEAPKIVTLFKFLLMIARNGNCMNISEVAHRLHISSRTVYRYIDTLNEIGFDIYTNPITIDLESPAIKSLMCFFDENNKREEKVRQNLFTAISRKLQVKLLNYSSASSGRVSDYFVEPFRISADAQFVHCFDLGNNTNKQFKIARINGVQLLDSIWQMEQHHTSPDTDIFHMSGTQEREVSLMLNLYAYRLLLEEFPAAEYHPLCLISRAGNNLWRIDLKVYDFKGVGRFYFGLADCIQILKGEEFRQWVEEFASKNIPNYADRDCILKEG